MVVDYFTKPLQGNKCQKFQDELTGVIPIKVISGDHRSVLDKLGCGGNVSRNHQIVTWITRPGAQMTQGL